MRVSGWNSYLPASRRREYCLGQRRAGTEPVSVSIFHLSDRVQPQSGVHRGPADGRDVSSSDGSKPESLGCEKDQDHPGGQAWSSPRSKKKEGGGLGSGGRETCV